MASKHREGLRNILYLCGLTLDNRYNFICAECITNSKHENYTKCKTEYGKTDPLAHFYCIINYFKRQDIRPPLELQQVMLIVGKLSDYIKKHKHLPPQVCGLQLEISLLPNGELGMMLATENYRIKLLSCLDNIK